MNFSEYINKCVKIDTLEGIYFKGVVIEVSDYFISLKDLRNNLVTLSLKNITSIREVGGVR